MIRSDVKFILNSNGFIIRGSYRNSELYEMLGNNIFAHVVSNAPHASSICTVMMFHSDLPLNSTLITAIPDLMDELESHPKFKQLR